MPDPSVREPGPLSGLAPDASPIAADEPKAQPSWRRSLIDVLRVAVVVVMVVLGVAFATDFLPKPLRDLIVETPLAIGVLLGGTVWLLWRIARRPGDSPR